MGKGSRNRKHRQTNAPHDPVYAVTKSQLEQMVANAMKEKIKQDGLVKIDKVKEIINDDVMQAIDIGGQIACIALMEQHILGINRIERDLGPAMQAIYDSWNAECVNHSIDLEFTKGILDLRYDMAARHTRRGLKK